MIIARALRASLTAFIVFILGFALIPTMRAEVHAAENVKTAVNWTGISLTLNPDYDPENPTESNNQIGATGHGDVLFNFVAPSSVDGDNIGTQEVIKKTIGISTPGTYYSVYLSTGSNSNALVLTGDTNSSINAHTSTWTGTDASAPTAFSGKGWGYAVPTSTTFETPFSSVATYANYDSLLGQPLTYANNASVYNSGLWAGVPSQSTGAQQIYKATTTNPLGFGHYTSAGDAITGDTTKDHFDIYYTAFADTSLVAGKYENTIIYTAVASASSLDTVSNNVSRSLQYITGSDMETLSFDLAMSVPTLEKSQVSVYLVPHSVTEANKTSSGYNTTGLSAYATDTYKCMIGSAASDFVVSSNKTTLNCIVPSNPDGKTAGGANMDGEYDFWIHIADYGYDYISRYEDSSNNEVASAMYAGLQSKTRNGSDYLITEMQQMTGSICKNTNAWGNALGESAVLYDYTGTGTALHSAGIDGSVDTTGWYVAAGSANMEKAGSFKLIDNRDQKPYLVRRLADGNCWMVQNLDLDLASFAGTKRLTAANTDLNSKNYWDPSESVSTVMAENGWTTFAQFAENYYGSAQEAQFQSGLQRNYDAAPEYRWATKCTSPGVCSSSNQILYSGLSAHPRSYSNINFAYTQVNPNTGSIIQYDPYLQSRAHEDLYVNYKDVEWMAPHAPQYFGDYYNYYAATAESAGYYESDVTDSICAKAWSLPPTSGNKSYSQLLFDIYGLTSNNSESSNNLPYLMTPISLNLAGYYSVEGNINNRSIDSYYMSSQDENQKSTVLHLIGDKKELYSYNKEFGFSARCVARQGSNASSEAVASTCEAGKICYDGNGNTSGSMSDQSASSNTDTILTAPNFARSGYGFAGWNTQADGFGTTYGPNETITTGDLSSTGLQLYAKWIKSSGTMQNWNACSTMTEHQQIALTDSRDDKTYVVTKLKDGNCWMTNNLALNLADFAGTYNLTSTNTDLNSKSSWDPEESESAKYTNDDGVDYYYNWYASVAGSVAPDAKGVTAPDSICPYGWNLPVTSADQTQPSLHLNEYYSSYEVRQIPASFTLAGRHMSASLGRIEYGTLGYYWSNYRSVNGDGLKYNFSVNDYYYGSFNPVNALSLRCAKK